MYDYQKIKPELFSDEGIRLFVAMRDQTRALIRKAGAATEAKLVVLPPGQGAASSFGMLACIDMMVENEELEKIFVLGHRVYVAGKKWRDD